MKKEHKLYRLDQRVKRRDSLAGHTWSSKSVDRFDGAPFRLGDLMTRTWALASKPVIAM